MATVNLQVSWPFVLLFRSFLLLQREGHIPWQTSYEHDVVFCLSAHNVKVSKRDGQEVYNHDFQSLFHMPRLQDKSTNCGESMNLSITVIIHNFV